MRATSTAATEGNNADRRPHKGRRRIAAVGQPAAGRAIGGSDSAGCPKARAASRPAPRNRAAAGSRSEAAPIIELTLDLDDERVVEAVAQLLLDLSRKEHDEQ
jgi:hypothetical protein